MPRSWPSDKNRKLVEHLRGLNVPWVPAREHASLGGKPVELAVITREMFTPQMCNEGKYGAYDKLNIDSGDEAHGVTGSVSVFPGAVIARDPKNPERMSVIAASQVPRLYYQEEPSFRFFTEREFRQPVK